MRLTIYVSEWINHPPNPRGEIRSSDYQAIFGYFSPEVSLKSYSISFCDSLLFWCMMALP